MISLKSCLVTLKMSRSSLFQVKFFDHYISKLVPYATSLSYLNITGAISESDLPVLTNIVQSHSTIEVVNINYIKRGLWMYTSTEGEMSSLVAAAGNSRLKKLIIGKCDIIELLNYANTNPKELILLELLIQPLAALLPNVTSLVYLEITGYVSDSDLPVLTNIVQSHPTLEVLNITDLPLMCNSTKLSPLVEAAGNSKLKKLAIGQCDNYY